MKTQVLVVGAGPVGLTMAAELARFGVRVRIIDKAPARTTLSKALILWSRTLELLARDGGTQDFTALGSKVTAANIIAGHRSIAHVTTRALPTPYPYALMLPQSDTERLLEERLNAHGVVTERQVELLSFQEQGDAVHATLRDAAGCEQVVQAEWLIGCDGAHSVVRHGAGLAFSSTTMDTDWVLADAHLTGFPYPDNEITSVWHEDGVLVVFPISPGRYRVVADVGASRGSAPRNPTLEDMQQLLDRRGLGGIVAQQPLWLSAFRINERIVDSYQAGRALLAGDAAHVHSPAGGQGMNTGMQDAFNLAWKLAMVCTGTAHAGLIDSYSQERRAIGEIVLRNAARLTEVATMRNPIGQHLRNLVGHAMMGLARVGQAMAAGMAEVSLAYRNSPLNGPEAPHAHPRPGERVMPVDGVRGAGEGSTPRFALYAQSGAQVHALLGQFPDLLEPQLRPPIAPGAVWLVRPDGYVAMTATSHLLEPIGRYLRGLQPARSVGADSNGCVVQSTTLNVNLHQTE